ncbi:MAG: DUF4159 domain-containing protein, partial [Alphaproteobacteria bacterium]|nr:DUF4159 domain-containing protein [Alphaproteobacteria bacterium]
WRRRPVGVASGQAIDRAQPFLSDAFYLERALEPAGAVTVGRLAELISPRMSVIALADVGQIVGPERASLAEWIDDGGVLIRFAGEHMAEQVDDLVPVALRSGGRAMGGALSWEQPAHLAAFPETSPFAGLRVPEDVVVRRQVLAEPSPDLGAKTWAQLADGTPLVTAARLGKGWIVLVHVSANAEWSTLPLSGVFVEMLRRLVELSAGVATLDAQAALPPFAVLDGFGRLGPPLPATRAATPERLAEVGVGPDLPPGYYGTAEARRAVNLTRGMAALQPVVDLPRDVEWRTFDGAAEVDLSGWLLTAALLLTTLDLALSLRLRGYGWAVRARAALLAICAAALVPGALTPAWAGEAEDRFAIEATRETHLAYVVTGDAEVDTMSEAGLRGLTQWLAERTAVEAAPPMGVDPKRDELVFFPLLYWPLSAAQPDLSDAALARVDAYMRDGGTILFDTRDQGEIGAITDSAGAELIGPGTERLRALLARLDIPPLMPIPPDHVLTKTFYLLRDFPGRWDGGTLWIERDPTSENDGVSALVIGSHDWAAAWAVDEFGQPVAALVPGGERQRVLAFRFGTNLVMYALSGNYKADQVHVPAILERLGQ